MMSAVSTALVISKLKKKRPHFSISLPIDDVPKPAVYEEVTPESSNKPFNIWAPIRNFLLLLKVFGILYPIPKATSDVFFGRVNSTLSKSPGLGKVLPSIWNRVVCVLVWVNVLRLLPAFRHTQEFDEKLFLTTVVVVWYFQCCCNVTTLLRANLTPTMLPSLFNLLHHFCLRQPHPPQPTLTRWSLVLIASTLAFISCNIALISYILFSPDPLMADFQVLLHTPLGGGILLEILLVLLQCVLAAAWILPILFYVLLCVIICTYFDQLIAKVKGMVETDRNDVDHVSVSEVGEIRLHHMALCDIVDHMDDCFANFAGFGLATALPVACFVLYMMFWPHNKSSYLVIFNAFIISMTAFHISMILVSASYVNSKAHAPLGYILKLSGPDLRQDEQFQFTLLLAKLQGTKIGISAWQLFILDKPSFLTIISILMTYFVILVQLKVPGADDATAANDTCVCTQ